jgi:hypothetical protein
MSNKPNTLGRQMTFWESDDRIVPQKPSDQEGGTKPSNVGEGKAVRPTREPSRTASIHSDGNKLNPRLARIANRAVADKAATFNNLYSALTYELLYEAYCQLKRGKAAGVDGQTLEDFGKDVIANLQSLHTRLQNQSYWPQRSIDRLMSSGKVDPELLRQLQSVRETGLQTAAAPTPENDAELAKDMQALQGRWRHHFWKNGKLVERMIVEFNGTSNTTQWVDENDNILRGRSGPFELSRSGGVKVMTVFLGGLRTDGGSFIYVLSDNQLRIVPGMLSNRPSLSEVELRVYNRIVGTNSQ